MVAGNSGNGAAKVEHGRGGVRVCSGERNRPREGERSEVARRGARGGPPYPRAGHGMDGSTRARGWRSTARSLQTPGKTTATVLLGAPWLFCFYFLQVLFPFNFCFLFISFQ